jgi:hypothetical protein
MTFLSELARLREAATKGKVSLTDAWLFVADDKYPIANFNFGGSKKADREFLAYLVSHSEAIEELVRAAEKIVTVDNRIEANNAFYDMTKALEKMNRSENET